MSENTRVIVPVKNLDESKTSFSSIFDEKERKEFTFAMLKDILKTVKAVDEVDGLVLTPDERVEKFAENLDIECFVEPDIGLNESLELAIKNSKEKGYNSVLLLPTDVPLVSPENIREILEIGEKSEGVVITPSKEDGTNALYLSPPDTIDLKYGGKSFFDHVKEAVDDDILPGVYRSENLERDLDKPEDLTKVETMGTGTETHEFLSRFKN